MTGTGWRVLVVTLVVAVATAALGWWVVPIIGFVFGLVAGRRRRTWPALTPAAAAFLGWTTLILWGTFQGGAARVAAVLGGVLGVPSWAVYLLPPVYAGLLGLGAALLGSSLTRNRPVPET